MFVLLVVEVLGGALLGFPDGALVGLLGEGGLALRLDEPGLADLGEGLLPDELLQLAEMLQPVMMMDYKQFYDGSSAERQLKYRMAWSIAYFLEKGAPKVRFQPFKDVKRRYVDALIRTQDMRLATAEAFGGRELLDKFTSEWLRFWKKM